MEANFCRRCGAKLTNQTGNYFVCDTGHPIYYNANPAVAVLLINDDYKVLTVIRKYDPGKGKLDLPGGFCDKGETFEATVAREIKEELDLNHKDYGPLQYLMSGIDPYPYKNETVIVIGAMFWSKIKSSAIIKPGDDVSDARFLSFDEVDKKQFQFASQIAALEKLHAISILH